MIEKASLKNKLIETSIVLATYNGQEFIEEQINSILDQTVLPDEIIIIDDCSSDNTVAIVNNIIKKFPKSIRTNLIVREKNVGYIENFLEGIRLSSGNIIFPCDQDDIWEKNKIEQIMKIFTANTDIIAVHSNTAIIDKNGSIIKNNVQNYKHPLKKIGIKRLIKKVNYPGMALAFKKNEIIPLFDELIKKHINIPTHDWIICYFASIKKGFYLTNKTLTYRRYTGNNVALNMEGKKLSTVENRIQGIELYLEYYNFIKEFQKLELDMTLVRIDISKYIENAYLRLSYLESKSKISVISNIKNIKYYPTIKSFFADLILVFRNNKN